MAHKMGIIIAVLVLATAFANIKSVLGVSSTCQAVTFTQNISLSYCRREKYGQRIPVLSYRDSIKIRNLYSNIFLKKPTTRTRYSLLNPSLKSIKIGHPFLRQTGCKTIITHYKWTEYTNSYGQTRTLVQLNHIKSYQWIPVGRCSRCPRGMICWVTSTPRYLMVYGSLGGPPLVFEPFDVPSYCQCSYRWRGR